MRIARLRVKDAIRYAILHEDETHLLVLKGDPLFSSPEPSGEVFTCDEVRFLSPVIPRSKVVCVKGNYSHVQPDNNSEEISSDRAHADMSDMSFYFKPNTSVIGPQDVIVCPAWTPRLSTTVSLGAVIKTLVKNISADEARDVIAGYVVVNDSGVDAKEVTSSKLLLPHDMVCHGFDASCAIGQWMVVDPQLSERCLHLTTEISHPTRSKKDTYQLTTRDMHLSMDEIIARVSQICTLLPGDMVLSGGLCIAGIEPGSIITSRIDEIGELTTRVIADDDQSYRGYQTK